MRDHLPYLLLLSLAWLLYFGIHSLLAGPACKDWVAWRWPRLRPGYRLGYNLLALGLLVAPVGLFLLYEGPLLWRWSGTWAWLANGLALLALLGFVLSSRAYDSLDFLGLRQWRAGQVSPTHFQLSFWHRFVRHPWYSFGLVLIWTRDMNAAGLVSALWISLYLVVGSRLEERKLVDELGEVYARYRSQVPGLIPRPWRYLSREQARRLLAEHQ
jgi:protein-S-isoprenylcysteine O-methyltransferase Ste14